MKTPHILLVDDQKHIRLGLSQLLELEGYLVTCAQDGVEGLAALQHVNFDLLISDIKMPRVDGTTLLRAARRHAPRLPAILITGHADPDLIAEARHLGAYCFFKKPFDSADFLHIVNEVLDQRHLSPRA